MKKYVLLCMSLMIGTLIISAEKDQEKGDFRKLTSDETIRPVVVGFKKFSAQDLLDMDQEYRNLLDKIANPSYTGRCFGMDNHTISLELLQEVSGLSEQIKNGLHFEVIPIQGSCLINNRHNCKCSWPTSIGASIGSVGCVAFYFAGVCKSALSCNWAFLALWLAGAALPGCGAACGECSTCIYYRCCAEREIWEFDNNESKK